MTRCGATLDDLPDDLLLEILDYFGEQKNLPPPFRILFVLSRVNRRLRNFATPLLLRSVVVPRYSNFRKFIRCFRGQAEGRALWIRSIQIGNLDEKYWVHKRRIADPYRNIVAQGFPFVDLRSFTCWRAVANSNHLAFLRKAPHLTELRVAWSSFASFPSPEHWRELETLRLRIYGVHKTIGAPPPPLPTTFRFLTTLAIHDSVSGSWWASQIENVRFPNLRVLGLYRTACLSTSVYRFIHRHPTLLEVNVSFRYSANLRFDALVKLMEGTGTWRPNVSKAYVFGTGWATSAPKMDAVFDDPEFPSSLDIPEDTTETLIYFHAFAFARSPLRPESVQWDSPFGSAEPRYVVTALALPINDQDCFSPEPEEPLLIQDFFTMANRFPFMEELRLAHEAPHYDESIDSIMDAIGSRLSDWTNLRKLTLSWSVYDSWEDDPFAIRPYIFSSILDDTAPPMLPRIDDSYDSDMEDGEENPRAAMEDAMTLSYLREKRADHVDATERALRHQLGEDLDLEAHAEDPSFLVRVWEARHSNFMAKLVRSVAEQCPTLEELEWYPTPPHESIRASRWVWRIHRDASRKVRLTTGGLTCCMSGDKGAWPLRIMVGQELAYANAIDSTSQY
ncbi:hypothetical protein OBBRIDRAFT_884465 [Obba rivulosa]|uniref:F-box domain-containing protein n=1 Tax=Obba rivulosa TaxID=1052685 RepID=A0A8E2J4M1_9APHY|nr:hypothetical protein OBBRIDRAFT_884465 [Obba rivulosa]